MTHEPWSIWHQRDGTPIRVDEMKTSHVINARNMMERNLDKMVVRICAKYDVDTAELEEKRDYCLNWVNAFNRELLKRGRKT